MLIRFLEKEKLTICYLIMILYQFKGKFTDIRILIRVISMKV